MSSLGLQFQLTEPAPLTVMFYDSYMLPEYHTLSYEDFIQGLRDMYSPFGEMVCMMDGPFVNSPLAKRAFPKEALEKLHGVNLIVLGDKQTYGIVTVCDIIGYHVDSETPRYTSDLTPSFTITLPNSENVLHYDLPTLEYFMMEKEDSETVIKTLVPTMNVNLYMPTGSTYRITILMDVEILDVKTDATFIECNNILYGPFCGLGNIHDKGIRNLFKFIEFHCACFLNEEDNHQLHYRTFNMSTYDNNNWNIDPNGINEYHAYTFRYLNSLY
jgi:hypothetical protein